MVFCLPGILIRKMRESDLDAVSELAMLANPHAIKEKHRKLILNELKKNPDLSSVATDIGKVVGYVLADVHNDEAVVEDLAVAEEYQGKGVGKRLLNKELEILKRKGAKTVIAEVHYKCASAIPFYYKHNFRVAGFMQDWFGTGHDAIMLKLIL
jgi:ribosomal-protein-alanine N-acetyltransferase